MPLSYLKDSHKIDDKLSINDIKLPQKIKTILELYKKDLEEIYGEHLRKIILYGSYARGDFNKYSDVDIMILVDLTNDEIREYSEKLSEKTFDLSMDFDFDIEINSIVKNYKEFNWWLNAYPFYKNVDKEGVLI